MTLAELPQIQLLSVREKLELVDEIWKSVRDEADALGVSQEEQQLLDHRWAEFLADPDSALDLEEFKSRMKQVRE